MTTDNRTSEPTPEQVEAAAKAMHGTRNPWFAAYGDWDAAGFEIKKAFRDSARAALLAAQGAARPVNSFDTTAEHAKNGADSLRVAPQAEIDERIQAWERLIQHPVWRSCFEEERPLIDSVMERIDKLAELEMTVNELAPAPVLPSSGVDEVRAEAVREVARYINRIAPNGLVPKKTILADMEFAADRLGRGIHANGNDRAVQGGESRGE